MKRFIAIILLILVFYAYTSSGVFSKEDEKWKKYAVNTVENYYFAISGKDFKSAYDNMSYEWTEKHSYDWFCDDWNNNKTIELLSAKLIDYKPNNSPSCPGYMGGTQAIVKIRFYSEDYNSSGKLYKGNYTGKVYMYLTEHNLERGFKWVINKIEFFEDK